MPAARGHDHCLGTGSRGFRGLIIVLTIKGRAAGRGGGASDKDNVLVRARRERHDHRLGAKSARSGR
jgi:hypothetical protein